MAKGIAAKMIGEPQQRMHQGQNSVGATKNQGRPGPARIAAEGSKAYTGKLPGERKRQREREAETGVSA